MEYRTVKIILQKYTPIFISCISVVDCELWQNLNKIKRIAANNNISSLIQ